MDPQTLTYARDLGVIGLLVVAVVGGYFGFYVFRWTYDQTLAQHAKEIAQKDATIERILAENKRLEAKLERREDQLFQLLDTNKLLAGKVGI